MKSWIILAILVLLVGSGTAQINLQVGGSVPAAVTLSLDSPDSTFGPMTPRIEPYTCGDFIRVQSNCKFQIDTSCVPASGKMTSAPPAKIPLHNAMTLAMNSHDEFSLDSPVPDVFTAPAPTKVKIPVAFSQIVTWEDKPLAPGDTYSIVITFTVSPYI